MDFVADQLYDGRRFRALTVVKVSDLIYKNQIDIVIHKVIKVSLNGDTVINSTKIKLYTTNYQLFT